MTPVALADELASFDPFAAVVHRIRRLIAAEADCCSFMDFNIRQHAGEIVVELTVPDEVGEALARTARSRNPRSRRGGRLDIHRTTRSGPAVATTGTRRVGDP